MSSHTRSRHVTLLRVNCEDLRQYKPIHRDKRQIWRSHIVKGLCDWFYETVGFLYVVTMHIPLVSVPFKVRANS